MNFLKFLLTKAFWMNVLIAMGVVLIGYFVLYFYLDGFTRHDEKVKVPNVVGEKVEDLDDLLEKKGFRYQLLDSIFDRSKPKGIIVEQKPISDAWVKEGRKIYITINARSNKKIKLNLDNIIQSSVRGAIDNLSSVDVEIKSIEYKSYVYNDIVLAVKSASGRELKNNSVIDAGSKIILVVGQTGLIKSEVPDFTGKSILDAKKEVFSANFNAIVLSHGDNSCTGDLDSTNAIIVNQVPAAFEKAAVGSDVTLYYSCDPALKP